MSNAVKCTGVPTNCINNGQSSCANFKEVDYSKSNFWRKIGASIGGRVNAPAIAIKSLVKNSIYDDIGNLGNLFAYFSAYFLSFIKLAIVFTKKTTPNFWYLCYIKSSYDLLKSLAKL